MTFLVSSKPSPMLSVASQKEVKKKKKKINADSKIPNLFVLNQGTCCCRLTQ